MYQETLGRYAQLAKAAADLKRAVTMIETWTAKAEDARKRLLELETTSEPTVTPDEPVAAEPVTQ